ncbi:MAG: hypothetical protein E6Q50_13925 [Lysobacter sp.]|nr:MAG: hypothetical protein E6Q50_13925 [Lysobacter sp.]
MKTKTTVWVAAVALSLGLGVGTSSANADREIFIGAKCTVICSRVLSDCLTQGLLTPGQCQQLSTQCFLDCGQ